VATGEHIGDRHFGVRARRAAARLGLGAPPKLEGAQSRADLIIELAQRERLTVREILSRLGGGRGHFTFIGTPVQVVDTIVAWFDGSAADGFYIMAAALPSGLETFIDHVLPILRRKGLFREDYGYDAARTLRLAGAGQPIPRKRSMTTIGAIRRRRPPRTHGVARPALSATAAAPRRSPRHRCSSSAGGSPLPPAR
jgi:hypothetical protein